VSGVDVRSFLGDHSWVAEGIAGLLEQGLIAPDWAEALAPVDDRIVALGRFLRSEPAYQPTGHNIFRAFRRPLADVRVLVVGQDPYPNPRHPIGLCFAVDPEVRPLPASLVNIYRELHDDVGVVPPEHGDLSAWSDRGVMLLNRVLTVRPGASNSHKGKGWEDVTGQAIDALAARGGPLVAVLWGNDAKNLQPRLGDVPAVTSVHPSPLSAHRGFFGSKPFSQVNALLERQGAEPVDWSLPE
jgi:uracil-DNA glycosylase